MTTINTEPRAVAAEGTGWDPERAYRAQTSAETDQSMGDLERFGGQAAVDAYARRGPGISYAGETPTVVYPNPMSSRNLPA